MKSSGRIEWTVAEGAAVAGRAALLGGRRERGRATVWRIDDERCLPERAPGVVAAERADRIAARSGSLAASASAARPTARRSDRGRCRDSPGLCIGMPLVSSLDQTPWRSGSPQGVRGGAYGVGGSGVVRRDNQWRRRRRRALGADWQRRHQRDDGGGRGRGEHSREHVVTPCEKRRVERLEVDDCVRIIRADPIGIEFRRSSGERPA